MRKMRSWQGLFGRGIRFSALEVAGIVRYILVEEIRVKVCLVLLEPISDGIQSNEGRVRGRKPW